MNQRILILEQKTKKFTEATFHEEVSADQLSEAEAQWKPVRKAAVNRMLHSGKSPTEIHTLFQHAHWDWLKKAKALQDGLLAIKCFGIEKAGRWQGLMMLQLAGYCAKLEASRGKPLVYIEFLETAPWNLRDIVDEPMYGLVGTRLIEAAIRLSIIEGFHGRVGLLALPKAEQFYEKRCRMVRIEKAGHYGMAWYELTQEGAAAFLKGGKHGNTNE